MCKSALRRIAAVHLRALPVESVARGLVPLSEARPVVVKEIVAGRTFVAAVSAPARRQGVCPGMTLVEARARAPEIDARPRDPAVERQLLEAAAEALFAFSPLVEVAPPDVLLLEIGSSASALEALGVETEDAIAQEIARVLGAFGHEVTVAMADDVDTARTLAQHGSVRAANRELAAAPKKAPRRRSSSGSSSKRSKPATKEPAADAARADVLIAEPGGSARALTTLPLEAFLWTDAGTDPEGRLRSRLRDAHATLHVLGVRDAGHLATFPAGQVESRFGDAGALLMARALGRVERPLRPHTPPEQAIEQLELDAPIDALEPVLFLLKRLLDRLETRLVARGRAANALVLSFLIEPSRKTERIKIRLARPMRSARTLLGLCREKVQGALSGAIRAVKIEAAPLVSDAGAQLDLFNEKARRIEQVEDLVARLAASLGEQAVFSAELVDTYRPESAWHARPFESTRAFEERTSGALRTKTRRAVHALKRSKPREEYVLPETHDDLSVTGLSGEGADGQGLAAIAERAKTWPKAVERRKEDEPLPALPPRPLELLPAPEPGRLEADTLFWRGDRRPVIDLSGRERFEVEWWEELPLDREYFVAELEDGRKLWVFNEPGRPGSVWVHGIFD